MILIMLLLSQYYFGQNKIQYGQFDWLMKETEHFEIYYYKSGEVLVPFAEDVLEEAYNRLKGRFGYREKKNEEKIPVLIYKSHPDFEGTNVILERIPESVGGFTEIFKNRIVLPFDGSYSDFRHVLYHELVHVFQYRIFYGRGIGALQRAATLRIPLWFIEGMAEFESMGWDESAESFIRDAVLNNRLYPIPILNYAGGYVVYKEGQSILNFIKDRYGEKKIGELMNKVKVTGTLSGAIRQTLGIDEEKLNEEWMKSLKKEYWPLVESKDDVNDIATPIITHKEFKNIYNYAPSISPSGDVIVYYTDRAEEVQIRLASALNGEDLGLLIVGGRSPKFESLHLMDGHLDYSPDGNYIVFPAMEKGKDVLYIYDVKRRKMKDRLELPIDRIRWPEWSPEGSMIAFMGLKNGASDIYVYNLLDSSFVNITHDRYSDGEPVWMEDSILFVSDRPVFNDWDYSKKRLYITDLKGNIRKYLEFGEQIINPGVYKSNVYFISYRDGGKNLYVYKPDSIAVKQVTDLIGSLESFSISPTGKFAISVYSNVGWDIFLLENIEELKDKEPNSPKEFSSEYIEVTLDEEDVRRKAPLNFGIDYVSTTLGYYSDYGWFGYLYLGMSDILGNHRLYALFNNTDLTRSDFYINYLYLKHRLDYSLFLMKQSDYFLYGPNIIRGDIWSLGGEVWYPFNRFNRFELGLYGYRLGEEYWEFIPYEGWTPFATNVSYGTFYSFSFVMDNTIWGYITPMKGMRGRISLEKNLLHGENFWDVESFSLDLRKYWYISRDWNFAVRLYLLHSWGEDKRRFSTVGLGGGRTIRGYDYLEPEYYEHLIGTTAGFLNIEFRLPIIKRLELGFPPLNFGSIDGAFFMDIGGATYDYKSFRFFDTKDSWLKLVDPVMSFGVEFRLNLGITIANIDISKRTDLDRIKEGTFYDFYLGFPF
jgi:hypothetical protein